MSLDAYFTLEWGDQYSTTPTANENGGKEEDKGNGDADTEHGVCDRSCVLVLLLSNATVFNVNLGLHRGIDTVIRRNTGQIRRESGG